MTVYNFLVDFALASVLILIGQFLRAKISFFQRFFMPSSMIAGFLGLILGPSILGLMPFSGAMSSYAGVLIILVFTIVGLNGFTIEKGEGKSEAKRIFGFQFYRLINASMQYILPIILTSYVLVKIWPELNEGFGILLASGFIGGHGTAAAVGETFATLGWGEATDIAITFATVGILTGVFGGLALIKLATKKGHTSYIKDFKFIDGDLKTGLIGKENRKSIGEETISSMSLDTLCFHLSLVVGIAGLAYLLNQWIGANVLSGIPNFTVAYLVAMLFFFVFRNTKVYDYVDKNINSRISGTATDYLVFFGIASVRLDVIAAYAGPLVVMSIFGAMLVLFSVYPMGRGYNKDSWFERSIFCFGYLTGVFAIGFILLRIVDPENKSRTINDTALSTPIGSAIEIVVWSTFPALLMSGRALYAIAFGAVVIIVCAILTKILGTWWFKVPDSERIRLGVDDVKEAS